MKINFESGQSFQLEAIASVTDLFKGQPLISDEFELSFHSEGLQFSENGFGNALSLTEEQIEKNAREVQHRNEIKNIEEGFHGMHFSIEMETGTGKTYVYLRTIYELNKLYGFKKFVIVVPSIAIREGVLKNLQITHDHFQNLYNNTPIEYRSYDSAYLQFLRSFAASNNIQVLVINIDSFAKDENIINKTNERLSGKRPIEFIQSCNPIVIVDEPQNMETENRKRAIDNLMPLCTLRYSATHSNKYNLLYSLNPVKAYTLGLVKQIEVDSILSENNANDSFIQFEKIIVSKTKISARITIEVNTENGVKKKALTLTSGHDLYEYSNFREVYKNGFIVDEIDAGANTLTFTNGLTISPGETRGEMNDDVMKHMIRKTIEEHLKKEKAFKGKGIKVLSLFFIDKVKNYRQYDDAGKQIKGKFAEWFEEIYSSEISKPAFTGLVSFSAESVHNGYFSLDKKGLLKDTGGETAADDDTYKLIMRDKEKLLDEQTPLRFIFSHSALREGWDNPNVFQICTLNETRSEIKKRQEIGRGLRLAIDQHGQRITNKNINRLTVIANESYEDFAKELQKEILNECDVLFTSVKNKKDRKKVNYRKNFETDPKFLRLWEKIKFKGRYTVKFTTKALVENISNAINDRFKMPETKKPAIRSIKKNLLLTDAGLEGKLLSERVSVVDHTINELPDILSYIQNRTGLTRTTIVEILKSTDRLPEFFINPQSFMDNATAVIRMELNKMMVEGIEYRFDRNTVYDLNALYETNVEVYSDEDDFVVTDPSKTVHENLIPLDSNVEKTFAGDCESNVDVEFYFKLPKGFKIDTPIGSYNPDWAVVLENSNRFYFVVETKGKNQELLNSEELKIRCGKAHFSGLDGISYVRATTLSDLATS